MPISRQISISDASSIDKNKGIEDDFQMVSSSRRREFFSFLKSIRSFSGDLSSFTAPAFLLAPISLIEHPSFLLDNPDSLLTPAREVDPQRRAIGVLHFFLAALFLQFGSVSEKGPGKRDRRKKKPLNPILGELFLAHTQHPSRTELVCEQVSHHPPVTAYRIHNASAGVTLEGYNAQKTYFSGTVRMERIGHWLIHYERFDEDWVVTLPKFHLEGLIPPPPYPEMDSTATLSSSNGYTIQISFSGKGWLRGTKNSFSAQILTRTDPVPNSQSNILYTAEGQWCSGRYTVKDAMTGAVLQTVDTSTPRKVAELIVKPLPEQDLLESRKAWEHVIRAIEKGDMATVTQEKGRIEEEQRALRKKEQAEGREWETRYFDKVQGWQVAEDLLAGVGMEIENQRTKGVWRW